MHSGDNVSPTNASPPSGGAKSKGEKAVSESAYQSSIPLADSNKSTSSSSDMSAGQSPGSSYPTSPATGYIVSDLDQDLQSPPTSPSQRSSSDELSKTFAVNPATTRSLLQARLALNLHLKSSSSRRKHTRSSSAWSSNDENIPATPVSVRSHSSSVRSTASSMFERMCGPQKKVPITTLHSERKSSMGVFTPVSARTASTALRNAAGMPRGSMGRQRALSALAQAAPIFVEADDSELEDGCEGWHGEIVRRPRAAGRASLSGLVPPTVCLTHSSFQAPSILDLVLSRSPVDDPSSPFTPPKNVAPQFHMSHRPPAPSASPSAVGARRAQSLPPAASEKLQDPPRLEEPSSGFPPLDPMLAALEKSCRLKTEVVCAACGTIGYDFSKDRQGRAICSRECRIMLKATEAGVRGKRGVGEDIAFPMLRAV